LIDLVPTPSDNLFFSNFNRVTQIRAIRPGDDVDLIDLSVDTEDGKAIAYRDDLRRSRGEMTLELTYTDIYETRFPVYALRLSWFHRH
jgi:hypothetical protein